MPKCTPGSKVGCICIQISVICHVVASFTWLATTFLFHKQVIAALCSAATPFRNPLRSASLQRKIARCPRVPWSRSVRLFACKRARNGSLSLPTFCGQVRYHTPCGWLLIWSLIEAALRQARVRVRGRRFFVARAALSAKCEKLPHNPPLFTRM